MDQSSRSALLAPAYRAQFSRILLGALLCLALGCEGRDKAPPTKTSVASNNRAAPSTSTAKTGPQAEPTDSAGPGPRVEARGVLAARQKLDAQIAFHRKRIDKAGPKASWLDWERIALLEMTRARLTGELEAYKRAETAFEEAYKVAPGKSGPHLSRALLHLTLHQNDKVEPLLERVESTGLFVGSTRADIDAMRADLTVQSGDYEAALKIYQKTQKGKPTSGNIVRVAHLHHKMGNDKLAQKGLDAAIEAAANERKLNKAWALLQRGIHALHHHKLDEAMSYYQKGLEVMPGWYLIEEHVAEIHLRKGEHNKALDLYMDIIGRSPRGEFMDAIADTYEAMGKAPQAASWRKKATRAYEEELRILPEQAWGHAFDHFMGIGEHARALELAKKDVALRPGPEPRTKLIQAMLAAGKAAESLEHARALESSQLKTAEALATVALAFEANKVEAKRAKKLRDEAIAKDPQIFNDLPKL